MSEVESLSSILSNSEPPAEVQQATDVKAETPAAAPSAAPEAPKETPKAETAKAEPAEATPDEPKATRDEKGRFQKAAERAEPMVPLSALLAERAKAKRQDEPPKPKTSFLDNEDQAFNDRVHEHVNPLKEAFFEMSVDFVRSQHEDFDEVAAVFSKAAEGDPRLWDQMRAARNPAKYLYDVGQQYKELAPFGGNVMKYKDHAVAETKSELAKALERIKALETENETNRKAKEALESLPRSLNGSSSASAPKATDADPENIQSIVRFGNS